MAKRKRLTPAQTGYLAPPPALETKSWLRPGLPEGTPPIAQVAGEASAAAALAEVAAALTAARDEGRLVQRLPLAVIETDHLVRDRIGTDEDELALLMASLASHGQRSPIEVTLIGENRFGLISGWRRMTAHGCAAPSHSRCMGGDRRRRTPWSAPSSCVTVSWLVKDGMRTSAGRMRR